MYFNIHVMYDQCNYLKVISDLILVTTNQRCRKSRYLWDRGGFLLVVGTAFPAVPYFFNYATNKGYPTLNMSSKNHVQHTVKSHL